MHGIEPEYRRLCFQPSDINEHLPLLRHYAEECRHVAEFGTRGGVSTTALLAAGPEVLVTVDIDPSCAAVVDRLRELAGNGTQVSFINQDTTWLVIEPTEFLFIDASHTAANVRAELEFNEPQVSKYLGFHDTETYGLQGMDGKTPGVLAPIMELVHSGRWEIAEQRRNNNGLMILRRKGK